MFGCCNEVVKKYINKQIQRVSDYLLKTYLLISNLFITLQKQLSKLKKNIKLFITNNIC